MPRQGVVLKNVISLGFCSWHGRQKKFLRQSSTAGNNNPSTQRPFHKTNIHSENTLPTSERALVRHLLGWAGLCSRKDSAVPASSYDFCTSFVSTSSVASASLYRHNGGNNSPSLHPHDLTSRPLFFPAKVSQIGPQLRHDQANSLQPTYLSSCPACECVLEQAFVNSPE